jgi:hypothetical protein
MSAVLLEYKGEVLSDELRTRHAVFAGGTGEQPIVLRIQRDGGRLLPGKCHESNMTRPERTVKGNGVLRRRRWRVAEGGLLNRNPPLGHLRLSLDAGQSD